MNFKRSRRSTAGFTLIELLLVLVILGVLAGIVVPKFTGRTEETKKTAARTQVTSFASSLRNFEVDTGRFPTNDEGLQALVTKPGDLTGWHQYMDKIPLDPWGSEYVYRSPGTNGRDFDVFSKGPDRNEGGGDDIEP